MGVAPRTQLPRLLAITPGGSPEAVRAARALLARGGPDVMVLLRAQELPPRALHAAAEVLRAAAADTGGRVMLAERADVAACFRGEVGVQLPERGLSALEARAVVGPHAVIGASVHDAAGAARAAAEGADLLTFAPVLATPSKPATLAGTAPVLGFETLRALATAARASAGARPLTLYALGGLDARHARRALDCGVDGVATIRAAWASDALLEALRALPVPSPCPPHPAI